MMSATGTVATTTTSGSGACGINLTVAQRLDECLQDGKESRQKSKRKERRSSDLPVLELEYGKTKQRFSRLIEVAKNYNKQCAILDQSRLEVCNYKQDEYTIQRSNANNCFHYLCGLLMYPNIMHVFLFPN
jgi:hypothetical protein